MASLINSLSNGFVSNTPSGSAGGDLSGTYPDPLVALVGGVTAADIAAYISIKHNFAATTDPTAADDSGVGYKVGSRWINVTSNKQWICVDDAAGNAIWVEDLNLESNPSFLTPGQHLMGDLLAYTQEGSISANEVQYSQIHLIKGKVLNRMRCFQAGGGNAARNCNMGLYAQTTPSDINGLPVTKVAETASFATAAGEDGSYKEVNLGSSYLVPATGYYWTAFICDSVALKFATSEMYNADFLPTWRESGAGTVLPATTGLVVNPDSAVLLVAAREV